MRSPLRRIADNEGGDTLALRMRRRRFARFLEHVADLPAPVRVLDVGGTPVFWQTMQVGDRDRLCVTLLNLAPTPHELGEGMDELVGDARAMVGIDDASYDVVFSNSVIEHVGGWDDQRRMAREVRRVGRRYVVQTPNRWFPVEPHFLVPGFQFLPVAARAALVRRFQLGWEPRVPDRDAARAHVTGIRLLGARQMRALFPDARIERERIAGLTKSLVAVGGAPRR